MKVAILGGGVIGVTSAYYLSLAGHEVTLIDRRNFHLFQPLLYQVSTAILSEDEIAYPVRAYFRKNQNVEFFMAKAQGVNESLKAADQMRWVQMMNNIRNAAEETVLAELIYS